MINKVVRVRKLSSKTAHNEDLHYWLNQAPEKRIDAVELLRKQYHGSTARIQRVVRVTQRS